MSPIYYDSQRAWVLETLSDIEATLIDFWLQANLSAACAAEIAGHRDDAYSRLRDLLTSEIVVAHIEMFAADLIGAERQAALDALLPIIPDFERCVSIIDSECAAIAEIRSLSGNQFDTLTSDTIETAATDCVKLFRRYLDFRASADSGEVTEE